MDIGTFLLLQSPSARSSQEIYARGLELARVLRSMELFAQEVMPAVA